MEVPLSERCEVNSLNDRELVVASITPNSFFIHEISPLCSFSPIKALPFLINIGKGMRSFHFSFSISSVTKTISSYGIIFNNRIIWNV